MPHHQYLVHTLLPALALPLGGSFAAAAVAVGLLAFEAVDGAAATAAWVSVAMSAISFLGVVVRVIANDRESTRTFDYELVRLRGEHADLHARDETQQRQIEALRAENRTLRAAVKTNAANIETLATSSNSGVFPTLPPADPGATHPDLKQTGGGGGA